MQNWFTYFEWLKIDSVLFKNFKYHQSSNLEKVLFVWVLYYPLARQLINLYWQNIWKPNMWDEFLLGCGCSLFTFLAVFFCFTENSKRRKGLVEVQEHEGQHEGEVEKVGRNQTSDRKCIGFLIDVSGESMWCLHKQQRKLAHFKRIQGWLFSLKLFQFCIHWLKGEKLTRHKTGYSNMVGPVFFPGKSSWFCVGLTLCFWIYWNWEHCVSQ